MPAMPTDASSGPAFRLAPRSFADLAGWTDDDHAAALAALRVGAGGRPPKARAVGIDPVTLAAALDAATTARSSRAFLEEAFRPVAVTAADGASLFTGYYEPELDGSLTPSPRFSVPLYRPPDDLVAVTDRNRPADLDPALEYARRVGGRLQPHPDRAAIEAGCLAGRGLELVWLADPVDAYFVHVQGAARIRLASGGTIRVGFAGKSGHPYTSIGRRLVESGAIAAAAVDMAAIRAWLAAHPAEAPALLRQNRSFIFFDRLADPDPGLGPVAAAGVPLTPGRSLAVDRRLYPFHLPVWIETRLPDGTPLHRLMVAQDTGSAIVGPARGDIFCGTGDDAGAVAGAMQAPGRFVMLVPRGDSLLAGLR
jgi:membrane-bound lytic murein transglycosylase A